MSDDRKVIVSMNIERSLDKELEAKAKEYGASKCYIVRQCLKHGLKQI